MISITRLGRQALAMGALACFCAGCGNAPTEPKADKVEAPKPAATTKEAAAKIEDTSTSHTDPKKVVAKVNGKDITAGDVKGFVDEFVQQRAQAMFQRGMQPTPDSLKQIREQISANATTTYVRQELVQQALDSETSKVQEAVVDKRLETIRGILKKQGHTIEELLQRSHSSLDDVKKDFRKQAALSMLFEDKLGVKPASDKDIEAFYNEHKDVMKEEEKVRASHILIGFEGNPRDPNHKPPSALEKAETKKKAEEVLGKIKKGGDFAKLAEEYSTDTGSKPSGGDLGYFGHGQMVPEFDKAAFSLKPGEVSDPVETQFGYHIIKVVDHKSSRTLTLNDVREQIRMQLDDTQRQEQMPALMAKLQKEAKIELLDGSKMPEPQVAPAAGAARPKAAGLADKKMAD